MPHPTGLAERQRYTVNNESVAALLDALVEERARANLYWQRGEWGKLTEDQKDSWRTLALHELGLTDVWPLKEKE